MLTKDDAIEALKGVQDPELGLDIWTLGLVYTIDIKEEEKVFVMMTLTSPACPFGPMILAEARQSLITKGFKDAEIDITFDPPWQPNEDVRILLGLTF
ncbi:DUF59 domain-containing protein [Candidatus Woesearchaeota archaeon]|nr:DUF59 domain-containing protein [Candidatus Woesearchaeota archaeon]